MKITQGTFSFLPDLTAEQIAAQIRYALEKGWAIHIEYTNDPDPRNDYWDMWGAPLLDPHDPASIVAEINACCAANPSCYARVTAFDNTLKRNTKMSFLVNRPKE